MRMIVVSAVTCGIGFGVVLDEAMRSHPRIGVAVVATLAAVFALLMLGDALETDALGDGDEP